MEIEIQPQRATLESVSGGFQTVVLDVEEAIVSQSPEIVIVPLFVI